MLTPLNGPAIVIYHVDCADGFAAALSARKYLGVGDVEYYPGTYNQPPPDVAGKHVFLVDFSYPPEVIGEMLETCYSILILDHHKSAIESFDDPDINLHLVDLSASPSAVTIQKYSGYITTDVFNKTPKVYTLFDNNRSGAMIAWEFFNTDPPPKLIEHIQDYDLYRFALPNTREISAAVYSYPYDFEVWNDLLHSDIDKLAVEGIACLRKHKKDILENIRSCKRRMVIGGHNVPVVSAPHSMASLTGELMSEGEAFAAIYRDNATSRVFSLRSSKSGIGIDVSSIAKLYGGGGHYNAASFSVPRNHVLVTETPPMSMLKIIMLVMLFIILQYPLSVIVIVILCYFSAGWDFAILNLLAITT